MMAAGISRALGAALALGVPTFPCRADKAPACPRGFHAATADPAAVCELWRRRPGPLVGVPTSAVSGLDVFDIDAPRHPEAADWVTARLDRLPPTRTHRTRSGGRHLLFRHLAGRAAGPAGRYPASTDALRAAMWCGGRPMASRCYVTCHHSHGPRGCSMS